jgi:predicted nucleic acid-binding protein
MPLLFDTGPLYALADADDAWHERVRDFVATHDETILVPVTVIPELVYLLRSRLGERVERTFVGSLARREMSIEGLQHADVERAETLLDRYPDLGFVDCTVVAMAERLRLQTIVTTDRRHFSRVRPVHRMTFDLLP